MKLPGSIKRAINPEPNGDKTFFLIASLILIVANTCQYFLKPSGFPQGDSWAYAFGSEPSSALISFKGEALRKWPIVALNYALASDYLRIAVQTLFSTFAWIMMIRESLTFERNRKFSMLMIIFLATSPQIVSWNSIQLSESYAISSGVMCIVFIRRFIRSRSNGQLLLFSFLLFFFFNTKPSNFLAFVTLITVSLLLFLNSSTRYILRRNIKVTAVTLTIILYTAFLTLNQSKQDLQTDGFGESYAAAQAVAVITNVNPYSKQINLELLKVRDYSCLGNVYNKSPIIVTELLKSKCSNTEQWLTRNFQSWYFLYLVKHPTYLINLTAVSLAIGNSPYSMYGGTLSISPQFASDIFFGSRNDALRLKGDSAQNIDLNTLQIFSPILIWLLIMFVLIGIMANTKRNSYLLNHRKGTNIASIYCALFGIFSIMVSALSIPNEWFRQSIVGQVFIFLGVIQLISCFNFSEIFKQNSHLFDSK